MQAQVGWGEQWGEGWEGRGIPRLILTPFLSLTEDAELVQCEYRGRGPCWKDEREGDRCWARGPWLQ